MPEKPVFELQVCRISPSKSMAQTIKFGKAEDVAQELPDAPEKALPHLSAANTEEEKK